MSTLRQDLVRRIKENNTTKQFACYLESSPELFVESVLFLPPGPIDGSAKAHLHTLMLYFIRNLHTTRLNLLNNSE